MSTKVSRRSFLKGSAIATAAAGWIDPAAAIQATAAAKDRVFPPSVGPEAVPIALTVNGVVHRLSVEPRTTLAEALRGPLRMTGTKLGCDRGACSACTVLLDGQPVCSCMVLAIEVGQRRVTTIEGVASGDALHPVQAAFVDHDAIQCGYCTPGMVMSCVALLERNPHPDANEVRAAVSGHLCRCGTYPHVMEAVLDVAAQKGASKP